MDQGVESFDLSFLDGDTGAIADMVSNLFSFHVVMFNNTNVDAVVIELSTQDDFDGTVRDIFPDADTWPLTQIIVANGSEDDQCPYFHVIMDRYSLKTAINYKLETFFRSAGILGVHSRCRTALVVGRRTNEMGSSMVSIPYIYHISSFRPFDINSPIDLTCTESEMRRITGDKLLNMPGMLIPYCIPFQLHFKILQYLQHPCAAIITKYKKSLIAWIRYWDLHFATVFGSFEPW